METSVSFWGRDQDHMQTESSKRRWLPSPISPPATSCEPDTGDEPPHLASRDWSSLTDAPLLAVLRRLDTLEDFFAFRGVCRSWRALAAPSPAVLASQHPLILLTRFPGYTEAFFDIARRRLYISQLPWRVSSHRSLSYAHGHLVTAADAPSAKILLWNIFSEARVRLPKAPEPFRRVLLSSRPDSPNCAVVLFAKRRPILQYLHVGDALWTVYDRKVPHDIDDLIFFKGTLYALTSRMLLYVVHLEGGMEIECIDVAENYMGVVPTHRDRWLAVSGGELLVVCQRIGVGFDVFRWDFRSHCWEELLDLGGRALFMGSDGFAGSVDASGLCIRGNCIYYLGHRKDEWYEYSCEDNSIKAVSPTSPGLLRGQSSLAPVWVLPSIC